METASINELCERVETLANLRPTAISLGELIADIVRLENMLASMRTHALGELAAMSSVAESIYAKAAHVSLGQASHVLERAATLETATAFGQAFSNGSLSASHVDAFGSIYRSATGAVRDKLVEHAGELAEFGGQSTVTELRKRVAAKAREFEGACDAEERLIRQKKATRLSLKLDPETGMGRLLGWFDPETFLGIQRQLARETEARFHDLTPEYCPLDPRDRQQFLQAHALAALIAGTGIARPSAGAEIVIVRHLDHEVTVDWGTDGLDLPDSCLDKILRDRARIFNITIRNGDIVSAPGNLNLGRSQRLANRAQRRALAAVHSTCAVPGCEVRYWQTRIHHILPWEDGGNTDLANLLPLCNAHHARLHAENWHCQLKPGRRAIFTLPDGTTLANPPPALARAA